MKIWSLVAAGIAIAIFWAMLSMIFESVVFRLNSGWTFLPWYFLRYSCDYRRYCHVCICLFTGDEEVIM